VFIKHTPEEKTRSTTKISSAPTQTQFSDLMLSARSTLPIKRAQRCGRASFQAVAAVSGRLLLLHPAAALAVGVGARASRTRTTKNSGSGLHPYARPFAMGSTSSNWYHAYQRVPHRSSFEVAPEAKPSTREGAPLQQVR
jgi:hypothetical protein